MGNVSQLLKFLLRFVTSLRSCLPTKPADKTLKGGQSPGAANKKCWSHSKSSLHAGNNDLKGWHL